MSITYTENNYYGALLNTESLAVKPDEFRQQMVTLFTELEDKHMFTAWMHLPPALAHLIQIAVELGFSYHHADQEGLQLVRKLNPEAHIPGYATHYVGAGGVVIDDDNRLLVIQERFHRRKHYKLPGGALDPAEHIADGVKREVLEETGIRTEFLSLNCLRHWHDYRYGKSDIYFVCRLKPLSHEITIDPQEISEAFWMPVDLYLTHPDTHSFNRRIVEAALNGHGLQIEEIAGYGTPETHEMLF